MMHDLRDAARGLARNPGFTAAAVLTLALGIGATTAVFSVVNAMLLKPLPYPGQDRLLALTVGGNLSAHTGQEFLFIRERTRAFGSLAASRGVPAGWNLTVGNHAEYVSDLSVSHAFFDALGVEPARGRTFSAAEDRPGGPNVVILSAALAGRTFGEGADPIGSIVRLGGEPYTVVGMTSDGFRTFPSAELWTPLRLSPQDNSRNYQIIGRLGARVTREQASSELAGLRTALLREFPDSSEQRTEALRWLPLQQYLGVGNRNTLLILLGAVACLLAIACANVAGLTLARAVSRHRELAMRVALGAGRGRLVRQLLVESLLLMALGACLGLIVADWGMSLVPTGLATEDAALLDWRVLGMVAVLTVLAGVLSGIGPALRVARLNTGGSLLQGARQTTGPSAMRARGVFVVAQVMLAVVLVTAAGVLMRSLLSLQRTDPGFDSTNTLIGRMSLRGSTEQPVFASALDRIRELPGVEMAAVANNIPIERGLNMAVAPPAGGLIDRPRSVDWRYVSTDYFDLFRIPLRAGRAFSDRDTSPVAVVSEAFAEAYFGDRPAIGRLVQILGPDDPPREIVGIVGDVKSGPGSGWTRGPNALAALALAAPAPPMIYVPVTQLSSAALQGVHRTFPMSWVVRTRGPRPELVEEIQAVVRTIEPGLPFVRFESMEMVVARDLQRPRSLTALFGVFSSLAGLLAAIGLYGLIAYLTAQRRKEIGIRMALGARAGTILRQVLRDGLVRALIGVGLGLVAAAALSRTIAGYLFGVDALDPVTFLGVAGLFLLVAGMASLIPARRAARVDPSEALRYQ